MNSECEVGHVVTLGQLCAFCGRSESQNCGKAPQDQRSKQIEQLKKEVEFKNDVIVRLKNELDRYKEREAVQGWADL